MATERNEPDAFATALVNLTGVVADIQADPDVKTGNWIADDPLRATSNNVNTTVHCSFPTPTFSPLVGANLQEFRALVRVFDIVQTGDPSARIELWENGSLVRAGSNATILNDGGEVILSFLWNANEIATVDGSLVELKVIGTRSMGGAGAQNTVDIGAVEWNTTLSSTRKLTTIKDTNRGIGQLITSRLGGKLH